MNLNNGFIAYPGAIEYLSRKFMATPNDLAAWIFFGEIKAFVSINDPNATTEFNFAYWTGSTNVHFVDLINQCWFEYEALTMFVPRDRYINGKELLDKWSQHKHINPRAFILAKINESRLTDMHPITGYTKASGECPEFFPALEEALFAQSEILEIENSDLNFEIEMPVNPTGHLNHDPRLQEQANIIASDLKNQMKRKPTKLDVAKQLKAKNNSNLELGSLVRRIKKKW